MSRDVAANRARCATDLVAQRNHRDAMDREAQAVAGLLAADARHLVAGEVMCQGVCSRWYDPDALDDWGTCGGRECQRAAVNP